VARMGDRRGGLSAGVRAVRPRPIPLCPPDTPALRRLEQQGIAISELYRVLANHPAALASWADFAWSLRRLDRTPRALRELLILRAVQHGGARYAWRDHVPMALEAGVPEATIAALADWHSADAFDDATRAALAFADELIEFGVSQDAQLAELARFYSEEQIIELALTISFYTMVPRVLNALRVPLSPEGSR
jgi:4-carboxymuconolactone decarboxylase